MANGKPVKSSYKAGCTHVMIDRPRYENDIIPEDIPLILAYEDDDLMVIEHSLPDLWYIRDAATTVGWSMPLPWHLRDIPTYNPNDPQVTVRVSTKTRPGYLVCVAKTPDAKTSFTVRIL